jgi:hypothetical protein
MKILDYVKSLLPSFDKKRILENITTMKSSLEEVTLQPYQGASDLFKVKGFVAAVNKEFNRQFQQRVKNSRSGDFATAVHAILKSLPEKLTFLEGLVSTGFGHDVTRDGMTYQKASILKYLEVADFAMNYARVLLLRTFAAETFQINGTPTLIGSEMSKATAAYLTDNQSAFFDALNVLQIPASEMKEQLLSIPDIRVVPETASEVAQTVGASKLDPMQLGLVTSTTFNLIYHVRMTLAEWDVAQYKKRLEEKQALSFRLMALQEAYQEKQDPKLQEAISYSEGRLKKLNFTISQLEADYA